MYNNTTEQTNPETQISYPGIAQRVKALAIDGAILLLVFILAYNVIDFIGDAPGYIRGGILIFMFFLYEPLMVSFYGFTIGHYMMNLRVRYNDNPSMKIHFLLAIFRSLMKLLLGWISFLTISFNDRRRAIHDFAGNAVVIEVK